MISSVPEEFASVLWWRAGGFAAAVQYLEMDWPGDDGREQRVSVTSLFTGHGPVHRSTIKPMPVH